MHLLLGPGFFASPTRFPQNGLKDKQTEWSFINAFWRNAAFLSFSRVALDLSSAFSSQIDSACLFAPSDFAFS